jgi:tRNA G18 (ribose-2'-O)-methylase SpoU
MKKLRPRELRQRLPSPEEVAEIPRRPLSFVLDNVLDTFNVGAMFRLADAVAAERIYLCDRTPTPPNPRIHRSAVGTEAWVLWEYHPSAAQLIPVLRALHPDMTIIAVEQHPRSVSYARLEVTLPAAIIVGHETRGITPDAIELSDLIVELPMWGVTRSLNLVASAAVIAYKLLERDCRRD